MTESQTSPTDEQLFLTLVTDLITQAWVALGKWKHPVTDKIERNVPAAGIIIDILDMLNRKTTGNRTESEDRLLVDSLQQLKLNYVTEINKPVEPVEKATAETPPEDEKTAAETEPAATDDSTEPQAAATPKKKTTAKKKPAARKTTKKTSGGAKAGQSSKTTSQEKHDTEN